MDWMMDEQWHVPERLQRLPSRSIMLYDPNCNAQRYTRTWSHRVSLLRVVDSLIRFIFHRWLSTGSWSYRVYAFTLNQFAFSLSSFFLSSLTHSPTFPNVRSIIITTYTQMLSFGHLCTQPIFQHTCQTSLSAHGHRYSFQACHPAIHSTQWYRQPLCIYERWITSSSTCFSQRGSSKRHHWGYGAGAAWRPCHLLWALSLCRKLRDFSDPWGYSTNST